MILRVKFSSFFVTLRHHFGHTPFFLSSFHNSTFIYFFFFISTIEAIDTGDKTLSRSTDRGMAYAKFKAHKFSFLNITNIGSDYVLKSSECGLACVNIPSCFSFNLAAFSDIMSGKILCELLPSDIYNNSNKFVASQFHHHFSIAVSEKLTSKNISLCFYVCLCFFLSSFAVLCCSRTNW